MSSKMSPFIQNVTLHQKRQLLSKRVVRHPKQHPTLSKTTSNIIKCYPKRHLTSSKTSSVIQNVIRQSKRHPSSNDIQNVMPSKPSSKTSSDNQNVIQRHLSPNLIQSVTQRHPKPYATSSKTSCNVIQTVIQNFIRQSKCHPTSSVPQPHPKRHPTSS